MGALGIANDTTRRPLRRQEQLVRRLRVLVPQDLRPRGRADPRRRPPEVDRRGPRADDGDADAASRRATPRRSATSRSACAATTCSQGLGDGGGRALVDVRSPQEYSGELMAPPGYEQEGASRDRPHPERAVDPVGAGRPRRRHVQVAGRAARALRRQGRDAREGGARVLPHRRAQRAHVVRPPRAARLPGRQELRRLVDRVGQPRRRADRAVGATAGSCALEPTRSITTCGTRAAG